MKSKNSLQIRLLVQTSLYTAVITLVTAFFLHIPLGNGYVHLGDTFIYLAAATLPLPYAAFAASIGAAMADGIVGATIWVIPTLIIKSLMIIAFSSKENKIICKRNIIAAVIGGLVCSVGYGLAQVIITHSWPMFFFPNPWIQSAASVPLFIIIGKSLDKLDIKNKLFGRG